MRRWRAITEAVDIPVIAIGGITKDNVSETVGDRDLRHRSDQRHIRADRYRGGRAGIERADRSNGKVNGAEHTDRRCGMIRGVIFDVDGVLLNSMPVWENLGEIYLERLGIKAEKGAW